MLNGPILTVFTILQHIMSSVAESEVGGCYGNCREALPIRITLDKLGHKQPATGMYTDNTTAANILNNNCKQQCLKYINIHFYWIWYRIKQDQLILSWEPAHTNPENYPKKITLLSITIKCARFFCIPNHHLKTFHVIYEGVLIPMYTHYVKIIFETISG